VPVLATELRPAGCLEKLWFAWTPDHPAWTPNRASRDRSRLKGGRIAERGYRGKAAGESPDGTGSLYGRRLCRGSFGCGGLSGQSVGPAAVRRLALSGRQPRRIHSDPGIALLGVELSLGGH